MLKIAALSAAVVIALTFSAASVASVKTTGPGTQVTVYVNITNTSFVVELVAQAGGETNLAAPSEIVRGDIATFDVHNVGKQAHNFSVFGKTTPFLKPGARATILVPLVRRGQFTYTSRGPKGTNVLRGVFTVN